MSKDEIPARHDVMRHMLYDRSKDTGKASHSTPSRIGQGVAMPFLPRHLQNA